MRVMVRPIVIGSLGTISKGLVKGAEDLKSILRKIFDIQWKILKKFLSALEKCGGNMNESSRSFNK